MNQPRAESLSNEANDNYNNYFVNVPRSSEKSSRAPSEISQESQNFYGIPSEFLHESLLSLYRKPFLPLIVLDFIQQFVESSTVNFSEVLPDKEQQNKTEKSNLFAIFNTLRSTLDIFQPSNESPFHLFLLKNISLPNREVISEPFFSPFQNF